MNEKQAVKKAKLNKDHYTNLFLYYV